MSGRPLRIEICGAPFQVVWDPNKAGRLSEDDAGFWNLGITEVADQRITMRQGHSAPHRERTTMLHEVLHAVIRMTGQLDRFVKDGTDDSHPDERTVGPMAYALLAVLRDNPHLVAYLTEDLP